MKNTGYAVFIFLVILLVPVYAHAATLDEIVAMSDAEISPEIIIEVIEVTGLDDPLDYDTLEWLEMSGVDETILDYLVSYDTMDNFIDLDEMDEEGIENHPNYLRGTGFYHEPTGYNPLYGRNDDDGRLDRYYRRHSDSILDRGPLVYTPPVYVYNDRYNRFYNSPRYYNNYNGIWLPGGGYVIYNNNGYLPYSSTDPYGNVYNYYSGHCYPGYGNYYRDWYYDNGWSSFYYGDLYYDGHDWQYDHDMDLRFRWDDGCVSFRF